MRVLTSQPRSASSLFLIPGGQDAHSETSLTPSRFSPAPAIAWSLSAVHRKILRFSLRKHLNHPMIVICSLKDDICLGELPLWKQFFSCFLMKNDRVTWKLTGGKQGVNAWVCAY